MILNQVRHLHQQHLLQRKSLIPHPHCRLKRKIPRLKRPKLQFQRSPRLQRKLQSRSKR
jgi:hypothetical protein